MNGPALGKVTVLGAHILDVLGAPDALGAIVSDGLPQVIAAGRGRPD